MEKFLVLTLSFGFLLGCHAKRKFDELGFKKSENEESPPAVMDKKEFLFHSVITDDQYESALNLPLTIGKKPSIVMIHIDTLRADYVNPTLTPNLYSFSQKQNTLVFPRTIVGGTATYHSVFSLLHSQSSYKLEPSGRFAKHGSFFIDQLLGAGYKAHILGNLFYAYKPPYHGCPEDIEILENLFTNSFSTSFTCHNLNEKVYADSDLKIADRATELFKAELKAGMDPRFIFISLEAAHNPYSWDDSIPKVYTPSQQNEFFRHPLSDPKVNDVVKEELINSYKNAVQSVDYHFGLIMNEMDRLGALDRTIFVVYSDHGERLGEAEKMDWRRWGHGGAPHREVIEGIVFAHFPEKLVAHPSRKVSAQLDVIPTLMDYMNFSNYDELRKRKIMAGQSLLRSDSNCRIGTTPDGANFPKFLTFDNGTEKAWVTLVFPADENRQGWENSTMSFTHLTDTDDKPMDSKYKQIPQDEKIDYLEEQFGGCIDLMRRP